MSNFAASYDRQGSPEDLNHYYGEKENEEVWVEDPETGAPLAQGLQGCRVCDEAVRVAKSIANDRGEMVILHDHDGSWEIEPSTSEQVIERGDILNAILEELVDEDATPTPCAYDCGDCTQCRAFGEWSEGQD